MGSAMTTQVAYVTAIELCAGVGAEPWYDHDYIITLIGGRFYDQRAFNRAYLWGKPQP